MKRMLFNATHAEELRVAIVDGQKLVDIDIESAGRESRKSNIYKGVVTRIEPSLEACFINYGEERHGFLPFKEISKAYFKSGVEVSKARIQDAITEGQDIIVQVDKEERGSKGAALTTFISLAGRYLVVMPNNPRGGGVSRRVEGEDRQELRETMDQLDYPNGMSLIARTAGIGRSSEELQWDLNYLLQLWTAVEGAAGSSSGPFLIYQESSLVIRAIRDYFSPDIGELLVDTDDIYQQACQFMAHVMPDMENRVKRYVDDTPLFSRFQIEHQIETAYSRNVPLPSGGSIVIDHTEALVAIDVNSARSTRGSDIEETALRTNLEAADEVARQMRLRDLGGLIVIDFIDMEVTRNQRGVEQRIKDALHIDRARVQAGKISRFGLMELSRQRIRPALNEGTHITCPRCTGTGVIRDIESSALQVLRVIQEESMKENTAAIYAQVPVEVATYLLNEKRAEIAKLEARTKVEVVLVPNKYIETPHHKLERLRHDDERLATYRSSYEVTEGPSADEGYLERRAETVKPRQEAKVKGITPDSPAPKPIERAPEAAATTSAPSVGLFGRLFGWLSGGAANEANVKTAESETTTPSRGRKSAGNSGEGRGNRGPRDRTRGKRDDNGNGTRSRRGRNAGTSDNPEEKADSAVPSRDTESRRGRGGRNTRPERTPEADTSVDNKVTAQANEDSESREDSRRRRRRRKPETSDTPNQEANLAEAVSEAPSEQAETLEAVAATSEREGGSSSAVAAAAAAAATALNDSEPATDDTDNEESEPQSEVVSAEESSGEAPRKRSRRRRGRRGGGRDDAGTEAAEGSSENDETSDEGVANIAAANNDDSDEQTSADTEVASDDIQIVAATEASTDSPEENRPARPRRRRRAAEPVSEEATDDAQTATDSTAPESTEGSEPAKNSRSRKSSGSRAKKVAETVDDQPIQTQPVTVEAVSEPAAEPAQEPAKQPAATVALNGITTSEAIAEEIVAPVEVKPVVEVQPVASVSEPVEVPKAVPQPEPEVTPVPAAIASPAQAEADAQNISEAVRQSGMQMVETAAAAVAPVAPVKTAPRPRRARKKASVAPPAALKQIETDEPPAP